MSVQNNQFSQEAKPLCKDCNAFFGCQAFNGYCSSCFKKNQPVAKSQRKESSETHPSPKIQKEETAKQVEAVSMKRGAPVEPVKREQLDKKRCFSCNKKIGLLGVECKCTFVFCNGHRLPEDHECEFDHKQKGQKKLQLEMVKVEFQKIQEI